MGLLKKITRGAKKVVRKVVPKELGGILQVAAPFVSAGPAGILGGLATSLAGQLRTGQGRINPFSTLAAIAPSQAFRQFTTGARGIGSFQLDPTGRVAQLGQGLDKFLYGMSDAADVKRAQGLFGMSGDFKPLQGKLLSPTLDETTGLPKLSKSRLAALAASGLSLATATKQIEEEAIAEGASESDIDALKAEAADFWSTLSSDDFKVTPTLAQGGRVGFALGTRPTAQESGLGGLPIEADMRYSGGFMPYGAKEKADDVPARLSKNEFVFTADAVRAAGGGSVQKGAQKMYNTMKQLEAMGRA